MHHEYVYIYVYRVYYIYLIYLCVYVHVDILYKLCWLHRLCKTQFSGWLAAFLRPTAAAEMSKSHALHRILSPVLCYLLQVESVYLSVYLCICPSVHLSVGRSVCLSIGSLILSVYLCTYYVYLCVYLSIHPSIHPSVCPCCAKQSLVFLVRDSVLGRSCEGGAGIGLLFILPRCSEGGWKGLEF